MYKLGRTKDIHILKFRAQLLASADLQTKNRIISQLWCILDSTTSQTWMCFLLHLHVMQVATRNCHPGYPFLADSSLKKGTAVWTMFFWQWMVCVLLLRPWDPGVSSQVLQVCTAATWGQAAFQGAESVTHVSLGYSGLEVMGWATDGLGLRPRLVNIKQAVAVGRRGIRIEELKLGSLSRLSSSLSRLLPQVRVFSTSIQGPVATTSHHFIFLVSISRHGDRRRQRGVTQTLGVSGKGCGKPYRLLIILHRY
jgi:hypothetical protein